MPEFDGTIKMFEGLVQSIKGLQQGGNIVLGGFIVRVKAQRRLIASQRAIKLIGLLKGKSLIEVEIRIAWININCRAIVVQRLCQPPGFYATTSPRKLVTGRSRV